MSRNQKLAPLLAGRTVAAVEPPEPAPAAAAPAPAFAPSPAATWHVRFADGSTLAVRTDGSAPAGADQAHDGAVADVTQHGTTLTIAFKPAVDKPAADATGAKPGATAGATLVFQTAEAAACVMLRDSQGKMEYAD